MELKADDRKKLWAKAGGKCSKCKCNIFPKEESETNIGQECHISSHKPDHPSKEFSRYNPNLTDDERDKSYDNAILLCGNCHIIIDNPKNTQYTIEELHRIKKEHEAEINARVDGSREILNQEALFERIEKRKQLQEWISNHYKTLINTVFNDWYDLRKPLNLTDEQVEEKIRNRKNAIEHLSKEYPDIWKIWFEEREIIRKQMVEDTKKIREYVRNRSNEGLPLYLALKDIFDDDDYLEKVDTEEFGEVVAGKGTELIFIKVNNLVV